MIYFVYLPLINIIRVFTLQIYTFLRIVAHILVKKCSYAHFFNVPRSTRPKR